MAIFGVSYFPDGNRFVTTSDNEIGGLLWDIETGSELLRLDTQNVAGQARVSDDGNCILAYAFFQRGHLRVWTAPDFESIATVEESGPPW